MKVIIAAGGTGGHVFPGLAVAEEFKRRDSRAEMVFVGTEYGIESRIIPREGYPLKVIRAKGFAGMTAQNKARAIIALFGSVADSLRIIRSFRPDIVIGAGGYASVAIVMTACFLSIPTMILEQNSIPGLANRILGRFVQAICITCQESMGLFPKEKTYLTGNPVRMNILQGSRESGYALFSLQKNIFTVFIFGGSLGARSINAAITEALPYLADMKDKIQFLHQTGADDYEAMRNAYRLHGFSGTVAPFIHEMHDAYAASDLVISRAGATTLAELTALGKPSILIPYPYATGNHQEFNARKLAGMGAAVLITHSELSGESLAGHIRQLCTNEGLRNEMQHNSRTLGRPEAGRKTVDIAMSIMK
jgi:UDP-N-acetylglucosamine--N-acetylmuramyl-(pentapeptide) pyrophosphoryl-undecaprenol N-acetylglucosamine transferase